MANYYEIYSEAARETHIMIGGATRSGKSVFEHGVIHNIVKEFSADEVELWFIDPKKTELVRFEWLPHVKHYADNNADTMLLLQLLVREMDKRNEEVQRMIRNGENVKKYPGKAIYCFIDETADVIARNGKDALLHFQLLLQMAASANIHMVFCSQCVNRKLIPAEVQCNITCVIGLHTRTAIESRQLVGHSACAKLPRNGKCIMQTPDGEEVRPVPMYTDEDWKELRRDYSLRRVI